MSGHGVKTNAKHAIPTSRLLITLAFMVSLISMAMYLQMLDAEPGLVGKAQVNPQDAPLATELVTKEEEISDNHDAAGNHSEHIHEQAGSGGGQQSTGERIAVALSPFVKAAKSNAKSQASRGQSKEPPSEPVLPANMTLSSEAEMRGGELELIKGSQPVYYWVKNRSDIEARWRETAEKRGIKDPSKVVRIACLYAGFVRDYENMFRSCHEATKSSICLNAKMRKFYGNQRSNLLDSTDCDVYLSTWDIRGGGRYSTTNYDMAKQVKGPVVKYYYRHRIAGLHVQKYEAYQPVWKYMHKHRRFFPQTRPTHAKTNKKGEESWSGHPEDNDMLRLNDYSQSYKHWLVVQLALRSGFDYDLFFRLRCDLRMTSRLTNFEFVNPASGDRSRIAFDVVQVEKEKDDDKKKGGKGLKVEEDDDSDSASEIVINANETNVVEVNITKRHHVNADRIHTSNFDIADFGFMGSPAMIERLTHVWWYCLQPPTATVTSIHGQAISEYNLMVWRIIFDAKWEVDSGGRYLWVSRRLGKNPKQGGPGGGVKVVVKTIIVKKKPKKRRAPAPEIAPSPPPS